MPYQAPGSTFGDVAPPLQWMPGLRAGCSLCGHGHPFIITRQHMAGHSVTAGASPATTAIIAAIFLHRKGLQFVLSSRNGENHSCFRVGMAPRFVLSSRNSRLGFVLSSRNDPVAANQGWAVRRDRAQASASPSCASARAGARRVMMTRALAGRRPARRGSSSGGAGAASSIRAMS